MTAPVSIRRESIDSPAAVELIEALNAELSAQYPEPGANHFRLEADEIVPGRGGFFVAYREGRPIGCGAVRRIDPLTAEIKRMYVVPACRGGGVGRAVLDALEAEARGLGVRRLVLETGTRQLEALSLYERAGYRVVPAFGEYVGSPLSVCMAKEV